MYPEDGRQTEVSAFMTGRCVDISEVADPTFAQHMIGDGIAIKPSDGHLYAPVDGEVVALFPTGHAIGLRTAGGLEILLHIGLDTVELKGRPFDIRVAKGQKVKRGDLLVTADLEMIRQSHKDTITSLVVTKPATARITKTSLDADVDPTQIVMLVDDRTD